MMNCRRGFSIEARQLYWIVTMCFQLLLLVDSSQGRRLQQAPGRQRTLKAYMDSNNTIRHGPPVKSFRVSDGSWVDCVRIEQQIAAHHPALKDHIIRMTLSSHLRVQQNVGHGRSTGEYPQSFAREHGGCPKGSIPVQRRDPNRPLLTKSQRPTLEKRTSTGPFASAGGSEHEYAVVTMPFTAGTYLGMAAKLSVNAPVIGYPNREMSISQLWVIANNANSGNTAEVGWQTYPAMHPQDNPLAPHLFIYWTADNYRSTGCYNLACPGFVQTDRNWVLGGAMPAYTTLDDNANHEDEFQLLVMYDSTTPGWWLLINNDAIGYWPSNIYTTMKSSADGLEWGGEMMPWSGSVGHTRTAMGSGAYPSEGFPSAAYQRNLRYVDSSSKLHDAYSLESIAVRDANCYNLRVQKGAPSGDWGTYFFFGGPGGGNPKCTQAP